MSVNPTNIQPLLNGLKPGHRVGFDESTQSFKSIKGRKGGIDLETLGYKINAFVNDGKISSEQLTQINQALQNRADNLESRKDSFWIKMFAGKKIDKSVHKLRNIEKRISRTISDRGLPPTKVAPSTSEAAGKPSALAAAEAPPSRVETAATAKETPPPATAGEPSAAPAPPPPPTPGITGAPPPPPPPPPGLGVKKAPTQTFAHRTVTTEADKQAKLSGEPKRPTINPEDDLGKPQFIPAERKKRYAEEILAFVKGTPKTETIKSGRVTKQVTTHEENGLEHAIARLAKEIQENDRLQDEMAGATAKLHETKGQLTSIRERIKKLKAANSANKNYVASQTTRSGTVHKTFYCDLEYKQRQTEYSPLSEEDVSP